MTRGMIWRDPSGTRWHVDNVTRTHVYLTALRTGEQYRAPLCDVLPLLRTAGR